MDNSRRNDFLTRSGILASLSDDEVSAVSAAETKNRLENGAEYLDLAQLDRGICSATSDLTDLGTVLPRSAVPEATWRKLVGQLKPAASPQV